MYERISSAPPATDLVTAGPVPLPSGHAPSRSYSGSHRDRPLAIDGEPLSAEYLRRHVPVHDSGRHLAPLPHSHIPPVAPFDPRAHPVSSPPLHSERVRPLQQSSRPLPRQIYPHIPGQQYPDTMSALHSPQPPSDRGSSRRMDPNEYPRPHSRHPSHLSPHPDPRRIPPNHAIPHSFYHDDQARADWERDARHRESRERESDIHSPHPAPHRLDYPDYPPSHPPPRIREDIYHRDPAIPYPSAHISRSGSPGSHNSAIDQPPIPSRPDSRTQLYEERNFARHTSYRLRPISQSSNMTEDLEFAGHDRQDNRVGRSTSHDHARIPLSSTPTDANPNPTSSGPNNGSSGNIVISANTAAAGGGGGRESIYSHPPPPPPPPLGSGHPHYDRLDRGHEAPMRKRNRSDMDMDIDSDKDNMNEIGGRGTAKSRRNTPASGIVGEDRDKCSLKRYYDHRDGSLPPPPELHDN